MSPWPRKKVAKCAPFTYTGLDYFGPLYIQGESSKEKVWVCLFTCVTVRAIHLELIKDMTAEQFLLALRRFIARRGKPTQIIHLFIHIYLMVLLVGVVPVKLGYRRSKLNRIDVYVAFSLLIAGIVLCPISIFCKSLHSITFTNLN